MEIFDYYPIPHPYDVKERVNKGFRLPYDLQDEIRLLFPKSMEAATYKDFNEDDFQPEHLDLLLSA